MAGLVDTKLGLGLQSQIVARLTGRRGRKCSKCIKMYSSVFKLLLYDYLDDYQHSTKEKAIRTRKIL